MNTAKTIIRRLLLPLCMLLTQSAWAQNAIEALGVSQQGSDIVLKLTTTQPLAAVPASFTGRFLAPALAAARRRKAAA